MAEQASQGRAGGGAAISIKAVEDQNQRTPEMVWLTPVVNPTLASPAAAITAGGGTGVDLGMETTIGGGSNDKGRGDEDMHRVQGGRDDSGDDGSGAIHRNPAKGKQPTDIGGSERRGTRFRPEHRGVYHVHGFIGTAYILC